MLKKTGTKLVVWFLSLLVGVLMNTPVQVFACSPDDTLCSAGQTCCGMCVNGLCKRNKWYNYPTYSKVKIDRNTTGNSWLYLEFKWEDQNCGPNFEPGKAVEFEINIAPKCFLQPKGGFDDRNVCKDVLGNVNFNLPGGNDNCYVDVWNYKVPDKNDSPKEVSDRCGGLGIVGDLCINTGIATLGFEEKSGNFAVGLHDASKLKAGELYSFRYPVEVNNSPECLDLNNYIKLNGVSCDKQEVHNEWGFAWVTMQTFKNTCDLPCDLPGSKTDYTCPELIGAWSDKLTTGCLDADKHTDLWLNRICAPTDDFKFIPGFGKTKTLQGCASAQENHHGQTGATGAKCEDCDGDLLYNTDFSVEVYGSRAIDCNDKCSNVNTCSNGVSCGKTNPAAYCSQQCGGIGCGFSQNACSLKTISPCKGECVSGKIETKPCFGSTNSTERTCLDNCSWGPWKDCPFYTYPCDYGDTFTENCAGEEGKEKWECNKKGNWDLVQKCPPLFSSNPSSCNDPNKSCNPGDELKLLCSDNVSSFYQVCNDQCQWDTITSCPDDPCHGACTTGMHCDAATVTCVLNDACNNSCSSGMVCNEATGNCEPSGTAGAAGNSGAAGASGSSGSGASSGSAGSNGASGSAGSSCSCTSGVCCGGCNFLNQNSTCNTAVAYHCQGNNPGDDVMQITTTTYCSGQDSGCTGSSTQQSQVAQDCASNQTCQEIGNFVSCNDIPAGCTDTFLADTNQSCDSNTGTSGQPTLCLSMQQVSGSTWQYQVCKASGTFSSDHNIMLIDANHQNAGLDSFNEGPGSACSPWRSISINTIDGYGSPHAAGIWAQVKSPSNCSQAACTYRTGYISVRKECL